MYKERYRPTPDGGLRTALRALDIGTDHHKRFYGKATTTRGSRIPPGHGSGVPSSICDRGLRSLLLMPVRAVSATPDSDRCAYGSSFASIVISAFSSREMGQPAFASLAAVWSFAPSAPGIFAVTLRWTRVTVQPGSSLSRATSATV